ncbi:MAG: hypothetical protein LBE57_04295 [Methanosarcinales archaeon]|jgi:hypothetical protein|nr:hypothetical protein [Methanosarcinales archaeon]
MIEGIYTAYKYSVLKEVMEQEGNKVKIYKKRFKGKFSELKEDDDLYFQLALSYLVRYQFQDGTLKLLLEDRVLFEREYTVDGDRLFLKDLRGETRSEEDVGIVTFKGNLIYLEKADDFYTLIRPGGEAEADADDQKASNETADEIVIEESNTGEQSGSYETPANLGGDSNKPLEVGKSPASPPVVPVPAAISTPPKSGVSEQTGSPEDREKPGDETSINKKPASEPPVPPVIHTPAEDEPLPEKQDEHNKTRRVNSGDFVFLKLEKQAFTPYGEVKVLVAGITEEMFNERAFVAVFKAGAPHTEFGAYQYPQAGSSSLIFEASGDCGGYEMRLYKKDHQYDDSTFVASVPFTVAEDVSSGPATLELDKNAYSPYEEMKVSVKGITEAMNRNSAFVTVSKAGAPHAEFGAYQYPQTGDSLLVFSAPNESGRYEMRLYKRDYQYDDSTFVTSVPFNVV